MSGMQWRERARTIVSSGSWPNNVLPADREAVEALAEGTGYEPYYTLKGVVTAIEEGTYERRLSQTDKEGAR